MYLIRKLDKNFLSSEDISKTELLYFLDLASKFKKRIKS